MKNNLKILNSKVELRKELLSKIKLLRNTIGQISWYMDHTRNCEIEQTDFCTCGMTAVKVSAKKVYNDTNPDNI